MTPDEQRAHRRHANTANKRVARASQTEEQRRIQQNRNAAHMRDIRATETPEVRENRLSKDAERHAATRASETPEERYARNLRDNVTHRTHPENMPSQRLNFSANAKSFRESMENIMWVTCEECNMRFPGSSLFESGICTTCEKDIPPPGVPKLFSAGNFMDPGAVPLELSRLSDLEKMLIARVHPMMSVYRFKGQQFKYSGNVINFAQDVNQIANVLPCKPEDLAAILVVNKNGLRSSKEFRVRREYVRQALVWLKNNNPHYQNIHIAQENLTRLPLDGTPLDIPNIVHDDGTHEESSLQNQIQLNEANDQHDSHIDPFHIEEFEATGTVIAEAEPNQRARIEEALHLPNAQTTNANLQFSNKVINEFKTIGYMSMAFPALFPFGNADLRQARPRDVNPTEYFQYLMRFHDSRFAKDSRFRFFAWNSLARWRAFQIGDVYVKKNPQDANLTIEDIRNMLSSGDKSLPTRISYFAHSIRGSRSYWFTKLKELTAMVKQLGAPTIFFTLSAADMHWPEFFKLLDPLNHISSLPLNDQRKQKARLLNENPLIAAWFLQKRVDCFLKNFLIPDFKVVDYWYRYEWQNRGSGHVHGFLWFENCPSVENLKTNEDEKNKLVQYFDQLVSTVNPNPDFCPQQQHPCGRVVHTEENLNDDDQDYAALINTVMRHSKCGNYCLRPHKKTKQLICRFRFPFEIVHDSKILEEPTNSGMYRFFGRRNDELVCSHNRYVLQTWRANIDWAAVITVLTVVNYIAKYAAKAEPASKNFTDTFRNVISDTRRPCQTAKSAYTRFLMKSCSERDISAQECMHLLMGYALSKSSRKTVLLNLTEKNLCSGTVKRKRARHNDDEIATDPNFFSRYLQRPEQYECRTLLNMAKKHYYSNGGWHTSRVESVVRIIPEIEGEIPRESEKWESYCQLHVLLNHHYRTIEDAKGDQNTWADRYIQLGFSNESPNILPDPIDEDHEDVAEENEIDNYPREEWMVAAEMGEPNGTQTPLQIGLRDIDVSHDWGGGLRAYPSIDTDRKFVHNTLRTSMDQEAEAPQHSLLVDFDKLSHEQRLAHDLVIRSLQSSDPIRLIVCGGAGTGKSTLINAIVHSTNTRFGSRSVHKMAPTGVAAFNIGGSTIHHELAIPAGKSMNQPYKPIRGEQLFKMQEEFRDAKLLIIDEYSMVGRAMLGNIEHRCRDLFANDEWFGNISIILVGDMRQLPPVADSSLYLEHGSHMLQEGGKAYASFDKCIRLNHIFRQSGDDQATFRSSLLRLSTGTSTFTDWELFKTRDLSIINPQDANKFNLALRLFPTRDAALTYNLTRLISLGKPCVQVHAKHNCDSAFRADAEEAKGLEKILYLSVGARVMLRSNLATNYGLVNGAMGIIENIVYAPNNNPPGEMPIAIMVNFDNYNGPVFKEGTRIIPIIPQTTHWKTTSGTTCQRTQFPLMLCWAITIHKSQGLTLDQAVVDIGKKESLGLTFVALSRTRKLSDLAFDPMFTFERLAKIKDCSGLPLRMQEEERLLALSNTNV